MYGEKLIVRGKNAGITLIALIITIIILLILAGVTINLILGENGLFNTTKQAGEDYKQAGAREKLEAVLVELQADKITKPEYNEKDYIDNRLKQNNMEVEGDIVTVEGWQFEIDRSIPEIAQSLGKETEFKKDTRGKAKFVYDTETQNVAKVEVTIEIDASISGYTVQYNIVENSDTSTNWVDYTAGSTIEVRKNITIYGRIIDKTTNEVGYKFSGKISTIDETAPQAATITFDKTETDVNQIIQATVTQNDLESGIDITKCKYIVNQSSDKLGEEHTSWNTATAFTQATETLDITQANNGLYYLHVLSVDNAENKLETVSTAIRFKGKMTLWQGNAAQLGSTNANWTISGAVGNGLMVGTYGSNYNGYSYYRKATAVSKFRVNVTDLKNLTFEFNGVNRDTNNSDASGKVWFVIVDNATNWIRSTSVNWSKTASGGSSMTINVSDLQGEYNVLIRLERTGGYRESTPYLAGSSFKVVALPM